MTPTGGPTTWRSSARTRIVVLAALVVAAGSWLALRARDGASPEGFVTERIDRGSIASSVTATGTVNPVSTVQVGTYVSGPIRAIDVDFNSPVRKGQRVAKIDPAPFLVKVQQAEANLATARARVAKSRADLAFKKITMERNRDLAARELVAQSDYDVARSNHDQAVAQLALDEAGVAQSSAALEESRISLAYTDIVSPVDGVVVSRNVDVGQTVAASFQTPTLFLIAQDLTKMQVNANVSESDIGAVREGQAASFSVDAYPGRTFEGDVVQVRNAPITVQNVVTYDVVVAVDNALLALKPGMTATVAITTARRDDVLRVPLRALRFRPEGTAAAAAAGPSPPAGPRRGAAGSDEGAVWVPTRGGEPRRVAVVTGVRDDRYAEAVSGTLAADDEVIVALQRKAPEEPPARSPFSGPRMR